MYLHHHQPLSSPKQLLLLLLTFIITVAMQELPLRRPTVIVTAWTINVAAARPLLPTDCQECPSRQSSVDLERMVVAFITVIVPRILEIPCRYSPQLSRAPCSHAPSEGGCQSPRQPLSIFASYCPPVANCNARRALPVLASFVTFLAVRYHLTVAMR